MNTCYNALDLHLDEGHGNQPALIHDSPVTNSIKTFTYRELRDAIRLLLLRERSRTWESRRAIV